MPYIGNQLATQFQAFATQTITGDGSTGYTLDRAVANGKELLVYINNVKQEEGSGKSYTASGTTITFSEAVASGDSCYLVYMGSAQQTVTAPAGSIVSSQFSSADLVLPKTVTIGSAAEEDTKLVFDGNAQDYHVGLDDSEDKLTIGKGTSLGTTASMTFDANGIINKPLQPAFLARAEASQDNMAVASNVTIQFNTEVFDQNADYDTSSYTFTAPVTGKYQLQTCVRLQSLDIDSSYIIMYMDTSNKKYFTIIDNDQLFSADPAFHTHPPIVILADMDAGDTAKVVFYQPNGSGQVDLGTSTGDNPSFFSGYLVA